MDLKKFVLFHWPLERKPWIQRVILLVPLLACLGFFYLADPVKHGIQVCAFHRFTGLSCPTCGLSRSFHAFLHGKLEASFHYHLMGPLVMSGCILLSVIWILELATGKIMIPRIPLKFIKIFGITFFLIWLVFWLTRLVMEIA